MFNRIKKKLYTKLNIDLLRLQIENYHSYNNKIKEGNSEFLYNKFKSIAEYKANKNFFKFKYFDKEDNSKFKYNGLFNFKPFDSVIEGSAQQLNLSYLFSSNAIIAELLRTEILNNKNIDFKLNIKADKILNLNNFRNIKLNFKIEEGLIDFDNTFFSWKNYANFELSENLVYVRNGELILDGRVKINIVNQKEIYKFLLTPKNLRKKFNHIDLNFNYNFENKIIRLKDIRIDDKYNQNVNKIVDNISLKQDKLKNKIYLKNLLNEAIKSYAG